VTQAPVPQRIGNYQLERQIGRGAAARIWLARHRTFTHRMFAVKLTNTSVPHEVELFSREAILMSRLDHVAIPRIYDHGYLYPFHYTIMDYVPGVSVRQLLTAHRRLGIEQSLRIAHALATVLDYIHTQGVIHRDVTPSNLLIDRDTGRTALIDFGVARELGTTTSTLAPMTVGTPGYVAPEQATAPQNATYHSDLFSMGVVLFEVLTGNMPWDAESSEPVPTLKSRGGDGLPVELDDVFAKLLAQTPTQRYQTATAAMADIDKIIAKHTAQTVITPPTATATNLATNTALHPVESALAIDIDHDALNDTLTIAHQTGTNEVIATVLNAWGKQGYWRRQLLGRLANIKSIQNRTLYHYTLQVIIETRLPPTFITSVESDDTLGETTQTPTTDRWQISLPPAQITATANAGHVVVPGSLRQITCPHCQNGQQICPNCHGQPLPQANPNATNSTTPTCTTCNGKTVVTCSQCRGSGQLFQQQRMDWRRQPTQFFDQDDSQYAEPQWITQHCSHRTIYRLQEHHGIRPEWKLIPRVERLIAQMAAYQNSDSRIVLSELTIAVIPVSEFIFDLGETGNWLQPTTTTEPTQYRWAVYGFERILPPHRQFLDWQRIILIGLSGICFILLLVIVVLATVNSVPQS
jgi:eukaryotic-like serine/threonine-protein kinase